MLVVKKKINIKNTNKLSRLIWYKKNKIRLQKRFKAFQLLLKKKTRKRHSQLTPIHGIIHIKCSLNNTIVTLTDLLGNTKAWGSCGSVGFKGAKRSSRFAGQAAIEFLGLKAKNLGYKHIVLHLNGLGKSRNISIKSLKKSGLRIYFIKDFTSIAHNGCRPSKLRRL
jgi:small subunit ribosomal protein S11